LSFKRAVGAQEKLCSISFSQKNEAFQLSILNGGFINLSSSSLYISRPILKSGTLKIDLKVASKFLLISFCSFQILKDYF
jgi:hypothetical protein